MWNRSLSGLDSRRSRKDDGEAEHSREERRFCICDEISNIWIYRDLTAALPLLWTQEIRQTVGDPLHLLHLRVLHPTKMEDPSVSWRNLTKDKRAITDIASSKEDI